MPANISQQDLEIAIRDFADATNPEARTLSAYSRWARHNQKPEVRCFTRRFGTWRSTLDHYGLAPTGNTRRADAWTDDELIRHFEKVWDDTAKNKTTIRITEYAISQFNHREGFRGPNPEMYRRHFGSLPRFAENFRRYKMGSITLDDLRRVGGESLINDDQRKTAVDTEADKPTQIGDKRKPSQVRRDIFDKSQGQCQHPGCARRIIFSDFHVDHIIPRSCGGPDYDWNKRAICGQCNRERKDSVAEVLMRFQNLDEHLVRDLARAMRGDKDFGELFARMWVMVGGFPELNVRPR